MPENKKENIVDIVMKKIESSEPHSIFFINDFVKLGSPETIRKIFFQEILKNKLERIGQGIYIVPKYSRFGYVPVPLEKIAQEIAKRDKATILPTGSTAANLIGLSEQVPMNLSYITTGSTRTLKIGNRKLEFRHAAPKNFATKGKTVAILIQGIKEMGIENIKSEQNTAIKKYIESTIDSFVKEDIYLAPVWIQNIIKKVYHETLAKFKY